jgi:uncharacterized Zn-finger protein
MHIHRRHMETVHDDMARPGCDLCSYHGRYDNLVRHKRSVHGPIKTEDGASNVEERQKCPLCPSMFAGDRSDNLRRHMETVHSEVKSFECSLCSYATKRKDTLKKHMEIHQ